VIFSKSLATDAGGKPGATFPHPGLAAAFLAAMLRTSLIPEILCFIRLIVG
jgi:hypothetical protein